MIQSGWVGRQNGREVNSDHEGLYLHKKDGYRQRNMRQFLQWA